MWPGGGLITTVGAEEEARCRCGGVVQAKPRTSETRSFESYREVLLVCQKEGRKEGLKKSVSLARSAVVSGRQPRSSPAGRPAGFSLTASPGLARPRSLKLYVRASQVWSFSVGKEGQSLWDNDSDGSREKKSGSSREEESC